MKRYRTGWISDIHLGTSHCSAEPLLDFLREHEFDTLYLVGDIIDIWPQPHNDVIQNQQFQNFRINRLEVIRQLHLDGALQRLCNHLHIL